MLYYVINTDTKQKYNGGDLLNAYRVKADNPKEAAYWVGTRFTNGRSTHLRVIEADSDAIESFSSQITVE